MWEINSCYRDNGDLPAALDEAAEVIRRVGSENVLHVIARQDENILGAWWVDVIYRKMSARPS